MLKMYKMLKKKIPQEIKDKIEFERRLKQNAVQKESKSEGDSPSSGEGTGDSSEGSSEGKFLGERIDRPGENKEFTDERILQQPRSVQHTIPNNAGENKQKLKLHKPSDI